MAVEKTCRMSDGGREDMSDFGRRKKNISDGGCRKSEEKHIG